MKKPLFHRKKTTNKRDNKVYLPFKKPVKNVTKRKTSKIRISNIFKDIRISKSSRYLVLLVILVGLAYLALMYINKLRNTQENYVEKYVIGLENIPIYPNSEFIFENSSEEGSVKNFISSGDSAYRLPPRTDILDVYKFYTEKLPEKGWSFILSVPISSEEKKPGEYWVKDEKGLRIYSKFNDVWYQTLTKEEASNGLAEDVQKETERELLLVNNDQQDLLPDFPWILKIPKEYVISYTTSQYGNKRQLSLRKLGSEERYNLVPLGDIGSKELDYYLDDYTNILSTNDKTKWGVINSIVVYTNTGKGLKGTIGNNTERRSFYILQNTSDQTAYILDSNATENTFLEYIFENIKPQNQIKY